MKTRHKIALAAFATLVVGIVTYTAIPFPKFGQIHVFRADITPEDKKGIFMDRLYAYHHYTYVHKGMSFREIPCYSDDGSKHILDIKFNWDNSISISEKDHKTILHIDSIHCERTLSYSFAYLVGNEYHLEDVPEDAFYESISFYDSKQICDSVPYSITLLRQKRSLPNGPKRYGFRLYIDKKHLSTGNMQNEHVFEY